MTFCCHLVCVATGFQELAAVSVTTAPASWAMSNWQNGEAGISKLSTAGVSMSRIAPGRPKRLENMLHIGKSSAADLRSLDIVSPEQLAKLDPMETYQALASVMGEHHDPCVLYTLLAVANFQKTGERQPWWHFAVQCKQLLGAH
jgi:DNA transformation protein